MKKKRKDVLADIPALSQDEIYFIAGADNWYWGVVSSKSALRLCKQLGNKGLRGTSTEYTAT